jgi:predicted nucleic acid-binding protein
MGERAEVVADASPLIALERVGRLDLLRQLVGRVTVLWW